MPKQVTEEGVVVESTSVPNCPGSHEYIETEYYIDEDGRELSKPGRKVDWFAYIQQSKTQCDLSQIVARYLSGDTAVINVNNPISGDIASMPRNINELHDLGDRVKTGYEGLSDEIKGIFGNSFENFYKAVLNNQVDATIQAYAAAKAEAAKKAVAAVKTEGE